MNARLRAPALSIIIGCLIVSWATGCAQQETTTNADSVGTNAPGLPSNPAMSADSGTGGAREITMTAAEMRYDPNEITVNPGQQMRVILTNQGDAPHNIEFELPSGEKELEENVAPGATKTLEFTAPQEPGRYTFYCPVGNHRERGMTGTLIVSSSSPS